MREETQTMKQILLDNAYEAWAVSIRYCDLLLEGKATLQNKKMFVSSLHNAVELFLKQILLNENNKKVAKIKNPDTLEKSELLLSFHQSLNLNKFFKNISVQDRNQFYSIEFNLLCDVKFGNEQKTIGVQLNAQETIKLLQNLRNNETHFFVDVNEFLVDEEFVRLHNFMIDFYQLLVRYHLINCWEPPYMEYERVVFDREKIEGFSFSEALWASPIRKRISTVLDDSLEFAHYETSYELSKEIWGRKLDTQAKDFEDLWTVVDMMLQYGMIEYKFFDEENGQYIIKVMK